MKFSSTYVKPCGEIFQFILCTHQYLMMVQGIFTMPACCHVGSLISLWQSVQPMERSAMVVGEGRIHPFMSSHVPLCTVT